MYEAMARRRDVCQVFSFMLLIVLPGGAVLY